MLIYLRRCAALCVVIFLAGCVAMTPQSPDAFNASLQAAAKLAEQGQIEHAVTALHELARRNPARAEPWVYIAKIRSDEKKYSLAIVAAEEALDRDSSDAGVKVVRASAAMHVAAESVADLKGDVLLAGTSRTEAQALAQVLRKTYKDEELFPPKTKPRRSVRPVAPKPVDANQSIDSGASTTGVSSEKRAGSDNPNPFGSLLR